MKQSITQHHLQHYYEFKPLQVLHQELNELTNTLMREEQQSSDLYPWSAEDDERKNLTDRELLQKNIDVDTSCLTQKERERLMDMLYRYKEAFSLRGEIGRFPNVEVKIDVIDKTPFLLHHIM